MLTGLVGLAAVLAGAVVAGPSTAAAAAPAGPAVHRVMPLGDSITRGSGQTKHEYLGYRGPLQENLDGGARGFRYQFVGSQADLGGLHEGHGGWTVDQILEQIDTWLADADPDIVLLHIGTNNVRHHDAAAGIAAKLAELIARIHAWDPSVQIFVAKVVGTRDPALHELTRQYNALIPQVVRDAGDRVHLVDQSSVRGQALYDWAHPNDFGYLKMAYNWYGALNRVVGRGRWAKVVNPYAYRRVHVCQRDPIRKRNTCGVQAAAH
jgi:hypothetical protein